MLSSIFLPTSLALGLSLGQSLEAPARPETPIRTQVRDVHPNVRLGWVIMQAVPSPGVALGERGFHGMMSWQVTPVLYSWAMDRRLVPLRFFVVEPLLRQSGSVELFASPLYVGRGEAHQNVGARTGLRAYFPLSERGDAWSFSLGASGTFFQDDMSPSFDAGIYTLFGGLGLTLTVSPWFEDALFETTLRVRYF